MKLKRGMLFECEIFGEYCNGKIQEEDGYLYLCQNEAPGSSCRDTLGYKYSWNIDNNSDNNSEKLLKTNNVTHFRIIPKTLDDIDEGDFLVKDGSYIKVLGRAGQVMFTTYSSEDLKKCQENNLYKYTATISALKRDGWEVYQEEGVETDDVTIEVEGNKKVISRRSAIELGLVEKK